MYPLEYSSINGMRYIDKIIQIDQKPIGRTPRSNPATYTGLFTFVRDLFSKLPDGTSTRSVVKLCAYFQHIRCKKSCPTYNNFKPL